LFLEISERIIHYLETDRRPLKNLMIRCLRALSNVSNLQIDSLISYLHKIITRVVPIMYLRIKLSHNLQDH